MTTVQCWDPGFAEAPAEHTVVSWRAVGSSEPQGLGSMGQGSYLPPPSRHTVEQGGSQDTPGSCLSRQQVTEELHSSHVRVSLQGSPRSGIPPLSSVFCNEESPTPPPNTCEGFPLPSAHTWNSPSKTLGGPTALWMLGVLVPDVLTLCSCVTLTSDLRAGWG